MEVKEMEEGTSAILNGRITGIKFALATVDEIFKASISDFPISHASQLSNPFLGLPLESGKCEACGAAEAGQCEGHFGYIELPIPVYHPSHITELKRLLDSICLKCLKVKDKKAQVKNIGIIERALVSCCEEASLVSIHEQKTTEGACYLQLKINKLKYQDGAWNFLKKYGYRYGDRHSRPLLPSEAMVILKNLTRETKKKLSAKGLIPQDGYIMQCLPVPPNCLSMPDVSDGITIMTSDQSTAMLKKVMRKIEIIKTSRSGTPNFEGYEVESNDLQIAIAQYLAVRGTSKSPRDVNSQNGINNDSKDSTKAWLEKMKTLFISKGSGFSSRSVITGDAYYGVNEIGLPSEIAQRITFEERVTEYNMQYLQKLVDEKLCLTYTDGQTTYSLKEGSKGHTFLRPGQVVHRRVMNGDIIFINRPPTTHKHSLQALSVYIHDDHTVKINPLICGPLSADFDGDCVHLFYPQSLAAKAEVIELFSVEKQLVCSHNSKLNLQVAADSLLSLKSLFRNIFLPRPSAQQLAMYLSNPLPEPALVKPKRTGDQWTASEILQSAFPRSFDCVGEKYTIQGSEILNFEFSRGTMQSSINEILASIFQEKGPDQVLSFLNSLQPMLMENLFNEGFTVDLKDFHVPRDLVESLQSGIEKISPLLGQERVSHNELVEIQINTHLRLMGTEIADFVLANSGMGNIIDPNSDSAITKVVQQVGFLGLQLSDKGKFYTKTLVGDMASRFRNNYPFRSLYASEEFGLIRSGLFHGLDPFQEMVHSISAREVIVRSSRGLTEPGTLFKNLMAILRDVNVCYDGTVRNVCSNAIIQFQYGAKAGDRSLFAAGEPVGVLAATAMSNPAYKAVLDSSSSSNSSWELMKEILLCPATFKNVLADRKVTLYLNDCECGRKYCREKAAYLVKNHLKKVSLKDIAVDFSIWYHRPQSSDEDSQSEANLLGHVHLDQGMLQNLHLSMLEIYEKVQDRIDSFQKQKGLKNKTVCQLFRRLKLSVSESCGNHDGANMPCLTFFWQGLTNINLKETSQALVNVILPVVLDSIIRGDPRVCTADIIWIAPNTTASARNPSMSQNGELAVEILLEKDAVMQSGDAWRVVIDSCLPLIHLIDTTRSTPNAIKQVQELLGISAAFNQSVQRLSKSVSMVTKGIMKEHLMLVVNSMSHAGNMVGFNSGGIKALSRSSNVRGPFAEATLFTPKKCFERAAEKGHVDCLSSIVASCSWGKQVSVGTGSRFDILWDTREVGKDQHVTDVYDFLLLMRSSSKEADSGCLGADVDELDPDYDAEDFMSPEHGLDKPTFEDSFEFENGPVVEVGDFGNANGNWGQKTSTNKDNEKGWGASNHGNWGAGTTAEGKPWGSFNGAQKPTQSSWGADLVKKDESQKPAQSSWMGDSAKKDYSLNSQNSAESSWGADSIKKVDSPKSAKSSWGAKEDDSQNLAQSSPGTDFAKKDETKISAQSSWGRESAKKDDLWGLTQKAEGDKAWGSSGAKQSVWGATSTACGGTDSSSGWGTQIAQKDKNDENPSWNSSQNYDISVKSSGDPWGSTQKAEEDKEWGSGAKQSAWGATPATCGGSGSSSSWGTQTAEKDKNNEDPSAGFKSAGDPWGSTQNAEDDKEWGSSGAKQSSWGAKPAAFDGSGSSSSWGAHIAKNDNNPSWNSSQNDDSSVKSAGDPWGEIAKTNGRSGSSSSWGTQTARKDESVENPPRKSSQNDDDSVKSAGKPWGGKPFQRDDNAQWGKTKKFNNSDQNDSPRGWCSTGAPEWKQRGPREGRPIAHLTETRVRLDIFTSEEQEILQVVEPIMQSIKRIMHQSGYKDGDPFKAEDQSYILENVFEYHPEKTAKMGVGIDHVLVNLSSYGDTRCMYLVLTDGHKEDFSYRKCMENFVKTKYADLAEAFLGKYFRLRKVNSGKSVGPEVASGQQEAPKVNSDKSLGPEESSGQQGAPKVIIDKSLGLEEASELSK